MVGAASVYHTPRWPERRAAPFLLSSPPRPAAPSVVQELPVSPAGLFRPTLPTPAVGSKGRTAPLASRARDGALWSQGLLTAKRDPRPEWSACSAAASQQQRPGAVVGAWARPTAASLAGSRAKHVDSEPAAAPRVNSASRRRQPLASPKTAYKAETASSLELLNGELGRSVAAEEALRAELHACESASSLVNEELVAVEAVRRAAALELPRRSL